MAQEYFRTTQTPTTDNLTDYIYSKGGDQLSLLLPSGYHLKQLTLSTDGAVEQGVLPNGPFRDMSANIANLEILIELEGPGGHVCVNRESVSLGQIGLYQFFAFSDKYIIITDSVPITISGRIHANGNICANSSSGGPTYLNRLTSAARFYHSLNCTSSPKDASSSPVQIWNGSAYIEVNSSSDSTKVGWKEYANTTLGRNIQDESHGVFPLKVPFFADPPMQNGRDAAGNLASNSDSFRFYVDPVMPDEDSLTSAERLAYKADLRIINGVWYKNDGTFPGTPIWSDHPGRYRTSTNLEGPFIPEDIDVGQ